MVLISHIFMLKYMLQKHCSVAAVSPQGTLRNLAYRLLFCLRELDFGICTAARNVVLLMKELSMLLRTWTVQWIFFLSESALNESSIYRLMEAVVQS